MHQKPPILFFSSSDWGGKWGSRQQVARSLAGRGYPILFIEKFSGLEHFFKYRDQRSRRAARWREGLHEIEPNLFLLAPPLLLPGRYYSTSIAQLNAKLVYQRLGATILQFLNGRQPIVWMFKPEHHPLAGRFNESILVYHCIDEYTVGTSGHKKETIERLEKRLLHTADIVFANSRLTVENKRSDAKLIVRIPSGANTAHFGLAQTLQPHPNLRDHPQPILIFAGSINDKIDAALLLDVATYLQKDPNGKNGTLVLLGPILAEADHTSIAKLMQHPQVYMPGKVPFEQLPNWFAGADLCLLPYVEGEATRFRSPLKLYEYLATGLPIISTPHPEVDEMAHVVSITPRESWVNEISRILAHDAEAQSVERLEEAARHDWERRVDTMLETVKRVREF